MRQRKTSCVLLLSFVLCLPSILQARSLPDTFIRSTVFIHNRTTGATGTGFLVKRVMHKDGRWQLVLISNKHVLMPKACASNAVNKTAGATFSLNLNTPNGVIRRDISVVLRTKEGVILVKAHPRPNVDVAGVALPPDLVFPNQKSTDGSMLSPIDEDRILTRNTIKENFLTIGDSAIVLRYPLNLVEAGHVIPIARGAVLATSPCEDFRGEPAFLVDSTIVRGSSGSPVFIPITASKWIEEMKVDTFKVQQSYLIGIVSGTVKDWELVIRKEVMFGAPPEEVSVLDAANLGIVFRGECIIDVLNELGIPKWEAEKDEQPSGASGGAVSNQASEVTAPKDADLQH